MGSNYVITGGSFISEDELCHYGIKGMRWGIRRYQNPDGSLTPAGKKKLKTEDDQVCLIKITSLLPMSNYKRELTKIYEAHANKSDV